MSKKQNQKFPPKTIIQPDGSKIEFKKFNEDFPSGIYHTSSKGYQELYPSVYSIEIPGEGFTKLYDFFSEEYLENIGLINYDQYSLHNYLSSLRNRGYYLSMTGKKGKDDDDPEIKGLAQIVRKRVNNLIEDLDRLEDCLLIHRVRRLDLQGMPNELIVHSPFTKRQLEAGKLKIILDRISRQHTKNKRQKAIIKSNSNKGRGFGYLDRKATDERFQMNYQFIRDSFGESSRRFADFALNFFKEQLNLLRRNKKEFDVNYRTALRRELSNWGITSNADRENCYIAANKFRVIYCPTDEELLA